MRPRASSFVDLHGGDASRQTTARHEVIDLITRARSAACPHRAPRCHNGGVSVASETDLREGTRLELEVAADQEGHLVALRCDRRADLREEAEVPLRHSLAVVQVGRDNVEGSVARRLSHGHYGAVRHHDLRSNPREADGDVLLGQYRHARGPSAVRPSLRREEQAVPPVPASPGRLVVDIVRPQPMLLEQDQVALGASEERDHRRPCCGVHRGHLQGKLVNHGAVAAAVGRQAETRSSGVPEAILVRRPALGSPPCQDAVLRVALALPPIPLSRVRVTWSRMAGFADANGDVVHPQLRLSPAMWHRVSRIARKPSHGARGAASCTFITTTSVTSASIASLARSRRARTVGHPRLHARANAVHLDERLRKHGGAHNRNPRLLVRASHAAASASLAPRLRGRPSPSSDPARSTSIVAVASCILPKIVAAGRALRNAKQVGDKQVSGGGGAGTPRRSRFAASMGALRFPCLLASGTYRGVEVVTRGPKWGRVALAQGKVATVGWGDMGRIKHIGFSTLVMCINADAALPDPPPSAAHPPFPTTMSTAVAQSLRRHGGLAVSSPAGQRAHPPRRTVGAAPFIRTMEQNRRQHTQPRSALSIVLPISFHWGRTEAPCHTPRDDDGATVCQVNRATSRGSVNTSTSGGSAARGFVNRARPAGEVGALSMLTSSLLTRLFHDHPRHASPSSHASPAVAAFNGVPTLGVGVPPRTNLSDSRHRGTSTPQATSSSRVPCVAADHVVNTNVATHATQRAFRRRVDVPGPLGGNVDDSRNQGTPTPPTCTPRQLMNGGVDVCPKPDAKMKFQTPTPPAAPPPFATQVKGASCSPSASSFVVSSASSLGAVLVSSPPPASSWDEALAGAITQAASSGALNCGACSLPSPERALMMTTGTSTPAARRGMGRLKSASVHDCCSCGCGCCTALWTPQGRREGSTPHASTPCPP